MDNEASFIAGVLAQGCTESGHKALEWIQSEWFLSDFWRQVILVSKEILSTGRPIKIEHIVSGFPWDELRAKTLQDLNLEDASDFNLKQMAATIRKDFWERQYRIIADQIAKASGDPRDLTTQAMQKLAELNASMASQQFQVRNVYDAMLKAENGPLLAREYSINVVVTGIETLDQTLRMGRKTLGIIAAVTSAGKSTLAIQFAAESAMAGHRSLMVTLEMEHEEVQSKIMSHFTNRNARDYITGNHNHIFNNQHREAGKLIDTIACGSGTSWLPLESTLRSRFKSVPFDILFIDYLTLLEPPDYNKSANLAQRFGELSKAMRRLSQELGIAVVLVCQFNRKAEEGSEPMLNQLRESGQIENDCNWAILLWNEDRSPIRGRETRDVQFKIGKNRGGKKDEKGKLIFDTANNTFRE